MRFGKRLTEITENAHAHEPYISYKELKKTISKISALTRSSGTCSGDSSGDDHGSGTEDHELTAGPSAGSSLDHLTAGAGGLAAVGGGSTAHERSRVEAHQQEFFSLIDTNILQAKLYVQSTVGGLETMVGEWQCKAVLAGLIFTPEQLDEVSSNLPFAVPNQQAIVDWLISLKARELPSEMHESLVKQYNCVANGLKSLQQYIEVNLTAVRKILKKFMKKVPQRHHIQNVRDYLNHRELVTHSFQQLLATALQMERLMTNCVGGLESLVLLSHSINNFDDVLSGKAPAARIDVYAKPSADVGRYPASAAPVGGGTAGVLGGAVGPSSAPSTAPRPNLECPAIAPNGKGGWCQGDGAAPSKGGKGGHPGARHLLGGREQEAQESGRNGRRRGRNKHAAEQSSGGDGYPARPGGHAQVHHRIGSDRPPPPGSCSRQKESHMAAIEGGCGASGIGGGSRMHFAAPGCAVMPQFFAQVPVYFNEAQQSESCDKPAGGEANTRAVEGSWGADVSNAMAARTAPASGWCGSGMCRGLDYGQTLPGSHTGLYSANELRPQAMDPNWLTVMPIFWPPAGNGSMMRAQTED